MKEKTRVMGIRHTKKAAETVTLIEEKDINNCVVLCDDGIKCTAVHNQFNGLYYADDKYGVLTT